MAGLFNSVNYDGLIPLSFTYTDYKGSNPDAVFSVVVTGKSMEPDFIAGDKLIIDAAISAKPGCFVIAQNGSNEATFKKFRVTGYDDFGREEFELVPLNPDYPTMSSKDHDITIKGVMVRHMRDYKY
jgi:SOS-response transcriptional repressor LexA